MATQRVLSQPEDPVDMTEETVDTPPLTPLIARGRYRTYLILIPGGVLLGALMWLALVLGQIGAPVESSRWTGEIYQLKAAAAAAPATPKLLVVAGSSALFNIRTKTITEEVGIPAVNFGTAAALQIDYFLWKARRSLSEGDVVYLPLEYELYDYDGIPNEVLLDHVYARDASYLNSLSVWRQVYHVYALPWLRLYQGYRAMVIPPTPQPGPDGYEADTLNEYGDETINSGPRRLSRLERDRLSPVLSGGLPERSRAWQVLEEFIAWAHERDITVIAGFPATIDYDGYPPEVVREVNQTITDFYRSQGVPVIGTAEAGLIEFESFFDTRYHLVASRADLYTSNLIEQLRPHLEQVVAQNEGNR